MTESQYEMDESLQKDTQDNENKAEFMQNIGDSEIRRNYQDFQAESGFREKEVKNFTRDQGSLNHCFTNNVFENSILLNLKELHKKVDKYTQPLRSTLNGIWNKCDQIIEQTCRICTIDTNTQLAAERTYAIMANQIETANRIESTFKDFQTVLLRMQGEQVQIIEQLRKITTNINELHLNNDSNWTNVDKQIHRLEERSQKRDIDIIQDTCEIKKLLGVDVLKPRSVNIDIYDTLYRTFQGVQNLKTELKDLEKTIDAGQKVLYHRLESIKKETVSNKPIGGFDQSYYCPPKPGYLPNPNTVPFDPGPYYNLAGVAKGLDSMELKVPELNPDDVMKLQEAMNKNVLPAELLTEVYSMLNPEYMNQIQLPHASNESIAFSNHEKI